MVKNQSQMLQAFKAEESGIIAIIELLKKSTIEGEFADLWTGQKEEIKLFMRNTIDTLQLSKRSDKEDATEQLQRIWEEYVADDNGLTDQIFPAILEYLIESDNITPHLASKIAQIWALFNNLTSSLFNEYRIKFLQEKMNSVAA